MQAATGVATRHGVDVATRGVTARHELIARHDLATGHRIGSAVASRVR